MERCGWSSAGKRHAVAFVRPFLPRKRQKGTRVGRTEAKPAPSTATRDDLRPQTTDRGMTRFSAACRPWSAARGLPSLRRCTCPPHPGLEMCFPRPPLVVSGEASAQSRRRYFVGRKVTFSRGHVLGDTFSGTRLPRPPRGRVERSAVTEGNEYSWGAQRSRDTPTDTTDTTNTADTTGNAGSVEVSPRRAAGALRSRRRWFRRERKLRPTLLFSAVRRPWSVVIKATHLPPSHPGLEMCLPRPPRGRVERSAVTEGNEYSWGAQRSRDTPTDTTDTTGNAAFPKMSPRTCRISVGNAGSVEVSPRRAAGGPPVETTLVS